MKVVDASNNNGAVDFHAVKQAGAVGVWLKVSEGTSFVDATYAHNRAAASAAGLKVGGYHFGHPSNDPVEEANHFLSLLMLHPGDLVPMLDLEATDGKTSAQVHDWAVKFLQVVKAAKKEWPGTYSGDDFMHANALDTLPGPKWVADYGHVPVYCTHWDAWQESDHGICGLDTSVVRSLALLTYKAHPAKKVAGHAKKAALRSPAWFAYWANWVQHGKKWKRPGAAPKHIPAWAWKKLKSFKG